MQQQRRMARQNEHACYTRVRPSIPCPEGDGGTSERVKNALGAFVVGHKKSSLT